MKGALAAAMGLAVLTGQACISGQAFGEDAQSRPLSFTVRPSGSDAPPSEAVVRQERLLKRMAQNDFLFRSICVNCGDAWKHNSYAPFNPMRTLDGAKTDIVTQKPGETVLVPDDSKP